MPEDQDKYYQEALGRVRKLTEIILELVEFETEKNKAELDEIASRRAKIIASGDADKTIQYMDDLANKALARCVMLEDLYIESRDRLKSLEEKGDLISDGFGTFAPKHCPICGSEMQVVRPGDIRCPNCD